MKLKEFMTLNNIPDEGSLRTYLRNNVISNKLPVALSWCPKALDLTFPVDHRRAY